MELVLTELSLSFKTISTHSLLIIDEFTIFRMHSRLIPISGTGVLERHQAQEVRDFINDFKSKTSIPILRSSSTSEDINGHYVKRSTSISLMNDIFSSNRDVLLYVHIQGKL